jgi:anti-sigma regulatory factor (Ser/Thr protein kinase)
VWFLTSGSSQRRGVPRFGGKWDRVALSEPPLGGRPEVRKRPGLNGSSRADALGDALGEFAGGAQMVVCDLTTVLMTADAVEALHPIVRYLSAWPGAGLVVVCAEESEAWSTLSSPSTPDTMVLSDSGDSGLLQLYALLPTLQRTTVQLPASLTSPRAARRFVARALLDWRLVQLVESASLVVSEIVTNAVVHAASAVDVTLSRADGRVQIMVQDAGTRDHPTARTAEPERQLLGGRGLLLVERTTQAWGILPARPIGKSVWAVLDVP